MKKLLLSFSFAILGVMSVYAQNCTPGANYADSTYGVWPDTTQNFPNGQVGVFYSTDMNFKVPDSVTVEIDPNFAGSPINFFTVTNVAGLPPGLDYECNLSNCQYNGGDNGCSNIYGTPTTSGTYPISIEVTGNITIEIIPGFPTDVNQDITFSGYEITIDPAAGIFEIASPNFIAFPNPAYESVTLSGLKGLEIVSTDIVNMSGTIVASVKNVNATSLTLPIENLETGVYFIQIQHKDGYETVKFIKE